MAVGTGAIFSSVIELVRDGWSLRQGLSVSLTATGTLAVVASICGVA
ncbi:hypothetical protein [Sphingomonas sp. Y38-1Y]|nr:hypothetical protein [Sphingomonas sp. Y38-1Y]